MRGGEEWEEWEFKIVALRLVVENSGFDCAWSYGDFPDLGTEFPWEVGEEVKGCGHCGSSRWLKVGINRSRCRRICDSYSRFLVLFLGK